MTLPATRSSVDFSPGAQNTGPLSECPSEADAEALAEHLETRGELALIVNWEPVGRVMLSVGLDIQFLVEAYRELRGLLANDWTTHEVWLGDGGFHLVAVREQDKVRVTYEHCPGLNKAFLRSYVATVSVEAYAGAWSRLIDELFRLRSDQSG